MFYEIFMWNFKHRISLKLCLIPNEHYTNRDYIDRNVIAGNHVPPEFCINNYREQIEYFYQILFLYGELWCFVLMLKNRSCKYLNSSMAKVLFTHTFYSSTICALS